MADKNFKQLVQASRSYRRFTGAPVPREVLLDLIDTARFAPSGNNLQVLRFALANDPDQVASIARHHGWAALLKDFNGPAAGELPGAYIAICAPAKQATNPIRLMDCGIAAQTICLAAAEKGLGACMIKSFDKQTPALFGLVGAAAGNVAAGKCTASESGADTAEKPASKGDAESEAAAKGNAVGSSATGIGASSSAGKSTYSDSGAETGTPDYEPVLLIALGKPAPDEKIQLEPGNTEHGVKYWRSVGNVHHVPKLSVDELVL